METLSLLCQYLVDFFLQREMLEIKDVEKIKTRVLHPVTSPPPENLALYEKISKHLVEPERPQIIWHMRVSCWILKATRVQAHSRSSSPTPTHTHTHTKICNTYCFSTATVVYWTRLNLTLYVHCPSSFCSNSPSCSLSVIRPYLFLYYDCSGLFLCLHYKHRVQTYLPQQDSNPQFQKATG